MNFKNLRVEIRITSTLEQINFDSGRMIHENPEVLWFTEGIDTVGKSSTTKFEFSNYFGLLTCYLPLS